MVGYLITKDKIEPTDGNHQAQYQHNRSNNFCCPKRLLKCNAFYVSTSVSVNLYKESTNVKEDN